MKNLLPSNPRTFGAVAAMEAHPDWVRELAYNLWAFICAQNVTAVARMLNEGTYRDDGGLVPDNMLEMRMEYSVGEAIVLENQMPRIRISRQAIQRWKQADKWEDRWLVQMRDLEPAIHRRVANILMAAGLEAAEFLAALQRGDYVTGDAVLAKQLDTRAKVAQDIINRTGHMPHTRPNDGGPVAAPPVHYDKQLAGKSHEELRKIALGEVVDV